MRGRVVVGCLLLNALLVGSACAYPTSVNLIPTADVIGHGVVRLESELDAARSPLGDERTLGLYAQLGLGPRFELGLDVVGLEDDAEWLLNAKWQLLPEAARRPAVAVGVLNAGTDGLRPSWYVVASRTVGELRLHGGLAHGEATRGLIGAEYYWDDRTGVLADWTTGPGEYHALGLWRDLGRGRSETLYWAGNNTSAADDFVGLSLCTEVAW